MGIRELILIAIFLAVTIGSLFLSYNLYQPPNEIYPDEGIDVSNSAKISHSPKGDYFIVLDNFLSIVNSNGVQELSRHDIQTPDMAISWTSDGRRLALSQNDYLEIIDIQPSVYIRTYTINDSISEVKLNSTHFWYVSDIFIQVWSYNITHFSVATMIPHGLFNTTLIDFSPSGEYFLAEFDHGNRLVLYNKDGYFLHDFTKDHFNYDLYWADDDTIVKVPQKQSSLGIQVLSVSADHAVSIRIRRVINSKLVFLPTYEKGSYLFLSINHFFTGESFLSIHTWEKEKQSSYTVRIPYDDINLDTISFNIETRELTFVANYGSGYKIYMEPLEASNRITDNLLQILSFIIAISLLGVFILFYHTRVPELGGESNGLRIFLNYDGYRLNETLFTPTVRLLLVQNVFLLLYYLNGKMNGGYNQFVVNLHGWLHYLAGSILIWNDIFAFTLFLLMVVASKQNIGIKRYDILPVGIWIASSLLWRMGTGMIFNLNSDFTFFVKWINQFLAFVSIISFSVIIFVMHRFVTHHIKTVPDGSHEKSNLIALSLVGINTTIGVIAFIMFISPSTSYFMSLGLQIFLFKISLVPMIMIAWLISIRTIWT